MGNIYIRINAYTELVIYLCVASTRKEIKERKKATGQIKRWPFARYKMCDSAILCVWWWYTQDVALEFYRFLCYIFWSNLFKNNNIQFKIHLIDISRSLVQCNNSICCSSGFFFRVLFLVQYALHLMYFVMYSIYGRWFCLQLLVLFFHEKSGIFSCKNFTVRKSGFLRFSIL